MLIDQQFKKKLYIIMCSIIFYFCIITTRLFYLQIYTSNNLFLLSRKNYLRLENVTPPRGNILDCKGKLIATNRPLIQLVWQGTGNKRLDEEQKFAIQTIKNISALHKIEDGEIEKAEYFKNEIILLSDLSFSDLCKIVEIFPYHKNLMLTTGFMRFYPHNTVACHILGYLNETDDEAMGKMGLEKIFNSALRGITGQIITTINSFGHQLHEQILQPVHRGKPLTTTLDIELNIIANECLSNHTGTILLMEAQTGALRVIISKPCFDPNTFLQAISQDTWQQLQKNQPFLNRAFSGQYPPASLFKLITIIAALEQHIINEETTWNCQGSVEFCNRSYHCKNRIGHGVVTTQKALIQSCNVPLYEIGKKIKIDVLAHYAHMFGLGEKTHDFLPEKTGIVPTTHWKRTQFKKPWWPGETLSATIGQSFYLATPIQICRMIGAIVENFIVQPRILESEPIDRKNILLNKRTLHFVKNAMKQVILHGTGKKLGTLPNMIIYGKTGTAQVQSLARNTNDEHGWFAAHIRYKNHPPIVLVILVEHVGSSIFAVDIARDFLVKYCSYMDQQYQQTDSEQ